MGLLTPSKPFVSLSWGRYCPSLPVISFAKIPKVYTDTSGTQQVNETRYEEVGLSYAGAQFTWGIFMVCHAPRIRMSSHRADAAASPVVRLVHLIICVGRAVPCTKASATVEEQERPDSLSNRSSEVSQVPFRKE